LNGKLIFQLSLFGLAMGVATVFVIPSKIEPLFWLVIFVVCAVVIARTVNDKYFLHGFLVSMLNSVWITTAHIVLFDQYIARHAERVAHTIGVGGQELELLSGSTGISDAGLHVMEHLGRHEVDAGMRSGVDRRGRRSGDHAAHRRSRTRATLASCPEHFDLAGWRVEVTHLSTHRTTLEEGRAASG
jgi:hypothetical protein